MHDPSGYDKSADVKALREEVLGLRQLVARVAEASAIENVLINGFNELATQLQPLRELTPRRTYLEYSGFEELRTARAALDRPKWTGSKFKVEGEKDERSEGNQPRSMGS